MNNGIKAGICLVSAIIVSFLAGIKTGNVYYKEKQEYDDLIHRYNSRKK